MSPDDLATPRLNGRADDARLGRDPVPVVRCIGRDLAELHRRPTAGLEPRTPVERRAALDALARVDVPPAPYQRISPDTLRRTLETGPPPTGREPVYTHGAPVVGNAVLVDGVTMFEGDEAIGHDPAERDLAIVLRSIAEAFSGEATRSFLDAYEQGGGRLPDPATLDWYALLAAFR